MNQLQYKKTYNIPSNIQITRHQNILSFEGPLGSTSINLSIIDPFGCGILSLSNTRISVSLRKNFKKPKAFFSTLCTLIENKMQGVSRGF